MQIKNKKLIKPKLTEMLDRALGYYFLTKNTTIAEKQNKFHNEIIIKIIKRIFNVIESVKMPRSLPEQNFYWVFLDYLSHNIPETFIKAYKDIFGIDRQIFSSEFWHITMKEQFEEDSTAFDKMDEYSFSIYFNQCLDYAARNIFYCKKEDLENDIREWKDTNKNKLEV